MKSYMQPLLYTECSDNFLSFIDPKLLTNITDWTLKTKNFESMQIIDSGTKNLDNGFVLTNENQSVPITCPSWNVK